MKYGLKASILGSKNKAFKCIDSLRSLIRFKLFNELLKILKGVFAKILTDPQFILAEIIPSFFPSKCRYWYQ